MNDQLFKGPKLKVQRAKKHISDLHNEIAAYMRRKPYRIVVEQDTEPQRCVLVIRVREEVPDNLATIIGDAVHNLRTALDILACELVRINSGDPEGVYFPFCREGKTSRTPLNNAT